jgi:hypothetical protein
MPELTIETPDVAIEVEVWCGNCGDGLCGQSIAGHRQRRGHHITVQPCEMCVNVAREEGYEKGKEDYE